MISAYDNYISDVETTGEGGIFCVETLQEIQFDIDTNIVSNIRAEYGGAFMIA